MKTTRVCPKCHGREIIRIPGQVGAHGAGNNIGTGMTVFSAVALLRYICAGCGYSESWVDSAEDIARLQKKFGDEPADS